jgi:2-keto-4-pentenoate hydratase
VNKLAAISLGLAGAALLAGCASTPPEPAGCPDAAQTAQRVQLYNALQPIPIGTVPLSAEAAACGQRRFVAALGAATHGPVVGYKAGLTNPAVQQRFGISQPLRGTLLKAMLLPDNAELPARFGAGPFMEPDLVVEVGSSALHEASTPLQALAALRSVRPFIELPDPLVDDPRRITAPVLVLNNVGARLGVLGAPLPVRADQAFADALRDMTVRTTDHTGRELAVAKGSAILGHPLNAVLWLAAELKKDGITLKPGDLLSLGAFGAVNPQPGQTLRVVYEGLPGNPVVQARFR